MTLSLSHGPPSTGANDDVLAELVDQLIGRLERGDAVDPDALSAAYPEQAGALLELLPAAVAMADLRRSALGPPRAAGHGPPIQSGALGDYRVIREVGRGGMGIVYEAVQISLGRRVALKVLPGASAMDPRQLARFRFEAQAAAGLSHPHIVPVYAVGCERGIHYYAMQFIEGRSLADLIAGRPPSESPATPGPRGAARLALEAAEALEHAHGLGVLHRDVKPANLLVDARGHLWVADFGLARFLDGGDLTRTGDVLGTLRYLSPERASGRQALDPRSDVYSLGATLYELVTRQPAFDDADRHELLRRIAVEEPIAPRKLDPSIPRDLETILLKAIAKEPDARYGSAGELAEDLRRFLDDRPILARRPGLLERAARLARRHRIAVATSVVVLTAAALGLAAGAMSLWREQARTHENLLLALTALDDFCLATSGVELPREPERMQDIQDLQLQALGVYERILRQNPDNPDVRWSAARANHSIGKMLATTSRYADAERSYGVAERHLALLRARGLNSLKLREESADLLADWGTLLVQRKPEAQELLRRALAGHRWLAAKFPTETRYRKAEAGDCLALSKTIGILQASEAVEKEHLQRSATAIRRSLLDRTFESRADLAEAYGYLGHLLGATGRRTEGDEVLCKARDLTQAVTVEFHADPACRHRVVQLESLFAFPRYCAPPEKPAETLRACRAVLSAKARLAAEFPSIPEFRAGLASSHTYLASLLRDIGRAHEAQNEVRQADEIYEHLLNDHPTIRHYRQSAAATAESLGTLLARSGDPGDARQHLRRAMELLPESVRLKSRVDRLLAELPDPDIRQSRPATASH